MSSAILEIRVPENKPVLKCSRADTAKLLDGHPERNILLPYWNQCYDCKNPYNINCTGYVALRS